MEWRFRVNVAKVAKNLHSSTVSMYLHRARNVTVALNRRYGGRIKVVSGLVPLLFFLSLTLDGLDRSEQLTAKSKCDCAQPRNQRGDERKKENLGNLAFLVEAVGMVAGAAFILKQMFPWDALPATFSHLLSRDGCRNSHSKDRRWRGFYPDVGLRPSGRPRCSPLRT